MTKKTIDEIQTLLEEAHKFIDNVRMNPQSDKEDDENLSNAQNKINHAIASLADYLPASTVSKEAVSKGIQIINAAIKPKDIEVNDDGKTAYCDFCKTNKPVEGFKSSVLLYWGDLENPPEYGQQCPDCQANIAKNEAGMESFYSKLQEDHESGKL